MNVLVPIPLLGFVIATRAALGVGIGLLVADRVPRDRRRRIGSALVAIGAATTVPALMAIRRRRVQSEWPRTHSLAEM
jgi:hypothetical protein